MPKLHTRRQKNGSHGSMSIDGRRYTARFSPVSDNYAVRREGQQAIIGWVARDGRSWKIEGKRAPFFSMSEAVAALVRGA